MKTRLILMVLVIAFFSCGTSNKPLSDAHKEKIKGEVKELISTIIQACENSDAEKLKLTFMNSPDFVSLVGGTSADYDQTIKGLDGFFANVVGQKVAIKNEKYTVLDAITVLYTANSRWETKFKDNSIVVFDPLGMQFLLKKIDNHWKVLSWTEELK
jgi:hypothetical protein